MPDPAELLRQMIRRWVDDPDSDVEYAEAVDGRWAVRMRQTVRDATTVWWEVGDRSIRAEAYVLPSPAKEAESVYRLCLTRNQRAWRAHFALDREGAVVVRGRIGVEEVTAERLDLLLGEIYEAVETTFRPLVWLAFGRSVPREKTR